MTTPAVAAAAAPLDSIELLVEAANFFSYGGAKRSLTSMGVNGWQEVKFGGGMAACTPVRIKMRDTLLDGIMGLYGTRDDDQMHLLTVPDGMKRVWPVRVYGTGRIFVKGDFEDLRGGGERISVIKGELRLKGLAVLIFLA